MSEPSPPVEGGNAVVDAIRNRLTELHNERERAERQHAMLLSQAQQTAQHVAHIDGAVMEFERMLAEHGDLPPRQETVT